MPVPHGVDPGKYDRLVGHLKGKPGIDNPYAVAAASLKKAQDNVKKYTRKR